MLESWNSVSRADVVAAVGNAHRVRRPEGVGGRAPRDPARPPSAQSSVPPSRRSAPRRNATVGPQTPPREPPAPSREREPARAKFRSAEKARNRYERDEVKRFTRRARRRRTGWFLALCSCLPWAAWSRSPCSHRCSPCAPSLWTAPPGSAPATLEKAVDGQLGTPLALLSYGQITHDLAPYHLIRSYVTEIVPPGTLVIHVVERTPVGVIQGGFLRSGRPGGGDHRISKMRPAGYPLIQLGDGRLTAPASLDGAGTYRSAVAVLAKVDTITAQTHDDVTLTLTGPSSAWCGGARPIRMRRRGCLPN